MIQPYDEALLKQHFPSYRDPPPAGVFELAIACCGGTSTGPYVAGVLDFIWEAFEEWRKAVALGAAPDHKVMVRNLVGASAGGLGLGLAVLSTLKVFPHVYHDDLWAQYRLADPRLPAEQPKTESPQYRAWVTEISLDRLLSHPEELATGQVYLFHGAPAEICDTVLAMADAAPPARGRDWVYAPLEFRATIGNLRGVPHAMNYNNLPGGGGGVTTQYMQAHRCNVAFAVQTADVDGLTEPLPAEAQDAPPPPLGDAPDAHIMRLETLPPQTPADALERLVFRSAMVATSAIPVVFEVTSVPEVRAAFDWRSAYWDRTRKVALVDLPAWTPPDLADPAYAYDATDGGLFDNRPFDVAHQRLAGVRGVDPQDGLQAVRAIVLVDPLADDGPTPLANPMESNIISILKSLVITPILQDRLDTVDLAQIKDETVYSRYMIAPTRENPTDAGVTWGPTESLMGATLDGFLGFAAQPFREHDFLLGRRNAQQFLRQHFALPAVHSLFAGRGNWTAEEEALVLNGVPHRPLVPLRGRAADPQPTPDWAWQAMTPDDVSRYGVLAKARANAIVGNLQKAALSGFLGWLFKTFVVGPVWFIVRGMLINAITSTLTKAGASLNPGRAGIAAAVRGGVRSTSRRRTARQGAAPHRTGGRSWDNG
jgi:hypothetical protein